MVTAKSGWVEWLASSCQRHRRLIVLWGGVAVLCPLPVGNTLLAKIAIDDAVSGSTSRMRWLIPALGGLALIALVTDFMRRHIADRLSLHVQHDLRIAVLSSIQRLDGRGQDALRTGQVMSVISNDLQLVQELITKVLQSLGPLLFALTALGAMLWLSPLLTLISLIITLATIVVVNRSRKVLLNANWSAQQSAADVTQHIDETLAGIRVVRGFGQEERETARLATLAKDLFARRMHAAKVAARPTATLSAMPLVGQVAVLAFGGWLALNGRISTGTFLAFNGYVASLIGPARQLADTLLSAHSTRASVERIYTLIDSEPADVESPTARDIPDGPLEIRFDDVSFNYTPGNPVLDHVSFKVEPGEVLVVTGPSGSGKSTLSALIPRFYDVQSGSVRIGSSDATVDIRDIRTTSLRAAIGIAFQEPFIFSGSIRDNICCGRPDASEDEMHAAAKISGAHDFISTLPAGYDTYVGDNGITLSGGQRQRIALARTIVSRPRVLVLDEATSAVDRITEAAISEALSEITPLCTTIIIGRSQEVLALADKIAVLDKGTVVDIGTQSELMCRCSLFRYLVGDTEDGTHESNSTTKNPQHGGSEPPAFLLWPEKADPPSQLVSRDTPPQIHTSASPPSEENPRLSANWSTSPSRRRFRLADSVVLVRRGLTLAVLLATCEMLVSLAFPQLVRQGIDHAVATGVIEPLLLISGLSVLMVFAGWLISLARSIITARVGETFLYSLRIHIYTHLQRLGIDFYERELIGRVLTTTTADIDSQSRFIQVGLSVSIVSIFSIAGIMLALVATDFPLSLCALTSLPLLTATTWLFGRYMNRASTAARENLGQVNSSLRDNIRGLRSLQACSGENHAWKKFAGQSDEYRKARLHAQKYVAIYFPFISFASQMINAAIIVIGAYRIQAGTLTPGTLLAVWLYSRLLFEPIQQLTRVFDPYQQARIGIGRISNLLKVKIPEQETVSPAAIPKPLHGVIELRNVSFRYASALDPALKNISLTIHPGETVAIVGRSGSGKSTLIKLLSRFYNATEGIILLDGTDIRHYLISDFRKRISIVPQEAHLFSGSVAENICYGRPHASVSEIEEAVRTIGALAMVASLPDGFHHPVGECGQGLSAGQRQLVSFARSALLEPDVLLVDEGTSALDPMTEELVLKAYRRLIHQRTTIAVTHRLTTAANADHVLVLDGGRLVEQGKHSDLLAAGGHYARLWLANPERRAELD
ncbi:ABC transporter ATP-binding protein [Streptomyces sp. NBS 14/10]|uniref:ABC transporter ATP-binding protein n=1 Tax=Streptomyces sp. NBS 14/10 TaxID=1945643 RepID=UPI000B7F3CA2|nr:ABC transporter ATP-binding protein [Streptomyces sp. NBS 14/10]KAK1184393.1 ABC transporter ATP-binding protein [Streptomyces sp. NBS 14/10]